jgi:hypothetical protein
VICASRLLKRMPIVRSSNHSIFVIDPASKLCG